MQLTPEKRWMIAMTCFNHILQYRFQKSPEFHTAKLQRLSTGRCINVNRQSKNNCPLTVTNEWFTAWDELQIKTLEFKHAIPVTETPQPCCIIKLQKYLPVRCLNSRYYKNFKTGLTSTQNQVCQFQWIKLTELFNSVAPSSGLIPPWLAFIL